MLAVEACLKRLGGKAPCCPGCVLASPCSPLASEVFDEVTVAEFGRPGALLCSAISFSEEGEVV